MIKPVRHPALLAGALHLIGLLAFYAYIHSPMAERTQAAFYWMIWLLLDFPASLPMLSTTVWEVLRNLTGGSENGAYLLYHGIVGTAWWMLLGWGIGRLCRQKTGT